jgi:prepilin-type N-terminal cleavage/methylation domain-containing protein
MIFGRSLGDERGMTLVELVVAMSIFAVVTTIFMPMIGDSLRTSSRLEHQSESIDQARTTFQAIARELRSAECITLPAENTTGTTLRFTTNANNSSYEVTYSASGSTMVRQVTGNPTSSVVATDLVSTSDLFHQISTPRRTVLLTLRVRVDPKETPRLLTTTIAGRNAWRTC